MEDLISRQEAIAAIKNLSEHYTDEGKEFHTHIDVVIHELESLRSIDAVSVVRCKDCEYIEQMNEPFYPLCDVWDCMAVDDDGYCYRGQKMTEERK